MSTWTSTLPRFVPSVAEVATILIVPWSTTGRPFSVADVETEIVYTPAGTSTWNAPLASEVVSSSGTDVIVTGIDTGAPEGFRTVPDKRNPCARGRSRANDAA